MKDRVEIRLTGSGGQGVILASIILAEAAILNNKLAVQSQSYGPEARGGASKAEVVISDKKIQFPKVQQTDVLLALTQVALNKYAADTTSDTILIIDSSLEVPESTPTKKIISIPILKTATEVMGKAMVANIIATGAINGACNLVPPELLEKAVLSRVPKGTEELNARSLAEGYKLVSLLA